MERRIVVVSGAPGAGKTTLAYPLAAALGLPIFAKDTIKETLYDSLGGDLGDAVDGRASLPVSRRVGAAAMDLLWQLARDAPTCVLEANFRFPDQFARPILRDLTRDGRLVEVHCSCPPDEAARRYNTRGQSLERHRVHTWTALPAEVRDEYDGPIGIGPVIEVETTQPIDVDQLAAQVHSLLLA